jgi:lysophospholipase L1-like esterase
MKFSLSTIIVALTYYWPAVIAVDVNGEHNRDLQTAGSVSLGPSGNTCPLGSSKVMTKNQCRRIGKKNYESLGWNGRENDSTWPSGCYHCDDVPGCTDGTWFNKHSTGSSNGDAKPWCLQGDGPAPSPAPPPTPPQPQPEKVMFAGDSDISFWTTGSEIPNSVNEGVGGWTCNNVLKNIDRFLAQHNPTTVVLVCGENDFGNGAYVAKTFRRFKKLVCKINASGARVIYSKWVQPCASAHNVCCLIILSSRHSFLSTITVGTKPEPSTGGLHNKYEKYDQKIRSLAISSATELTMVDVYGSFEDLGNDNNLYANDELHLSGKGYDLWTKWAKQALNNDQCVEWKSDSCVNSSINCVGDACSICAA